MSDQTRNALDDAIRAHIASEAHEQGGGDDLVTHWILVTGVLSDDTSFWVEAPEGQPAYVGAGLLHEALNAERGEAADD